MSPVAKMDPEWAITEIDAFLHVTAQVVPDTGPGVVYFGTVMRGPQTDATARAHVVEQILDRTLPGWRNGGPRTTRTTRGFATRLSAPRPRSRG